MSEPVHNLPSLVPHRDAAARPRQKLASNSERPSLVGGRRTDHSQPLSLQEQGTSTSLERADENVSTSRRRRSRKRPPLGRDSRSSSPNADPINKRTIEQITSRFGRRRTAIDEPGDFASRTRISKRGQGDRKHGVKASTSRDLLWTSTAHRPVARGVRDARRTSEPRLKATSSLLSVSTTRTGKSGRSSGSGSTVTQASYDRRAAHTSKTMSSAARHVEAGSSRRTLASARPMSPNVFDFMEPSGSEKDTQITSKSSSSSSSSSIEDEVSDADSSDAPATPSSRSMFPSPSTARSSSSTGRSQLDTKHATSAKPSKNDDCSPSPSDRSIPRSPSVCDEHEEGDDDDDHDEETFESPTASLRNTSVPIQRSSSHSSNSLSHRSERVQHHEEFARQHIARAQDAAHYVDPVYTQHRSLSNTSYNLMHSPYAYHIATQPYQRPTPPTPPPAHWTPTLHHALHGAMFPAERQPAPDSDQRTITGYEQLALELSNASSAVQPLYRRFEYLNHRILLHLQDELCEMEEQLRLLDEAIAHMDRPSTEQAGKPTPASRRREASVQGHDLHHTRTRLLGTIFGKTEQYNRTISAYASMKKDSGAPEEAQIAAYRAWLATHTPVHEVETRFLQHDEDLVLPGARTGTTGVAAPLDHRQAEESAPLVCILPVALMLPLLLYSLIPSFGGRLLVMALTVVGVCFVAATTMRVRRLLSAREWAACGVVYVLLMGLMAACVPLHYT